MSERFTKVDVKNTPDDLYINIIQPEMLAQVARIHFESLPNDFLPSLGLDFLKKVYYPAAFRSEFGATFVSEIASVPVGFVTIAHDSDKFIRQVFIQNLLKISVYAFRSIFRDIRYLKLNLEILMASFIGKPDPIKGEIIFIAVDSAYRGQGIGKQLVNRALQYLAEKNVLGCRTKTLASNDHVIKMYENMGWQVRDRFKLIGREYVTIVFRRLL